jgi:hemolysin activation/secretion protein
MKVVVNSLRITGNSAYSEAELAGIAGLKPGSELTLTELRSLAAKISDYYHNNGYFIAKAYLPAQDIKDGVVTIAVSEGKYGKVILRNQTNLTDELANDLLSGLSSGDAITTAPLENRLLLMSDLPGVAVKSTLVPGASTGTSDLIVDVQPGQRVTGNLYFDNQGNRYTGANRYGATVNLNNPTGHAI